ncbi:MAG: hypothetical protein EAZ78_15860 [Oscillatoriales cyanobacterium]|nr:MAG: hypothetical protein EA000_20130 [Oscillatoriales cyanobacterium]TAD94493.1 MAG: hypothetical protein EAZ98_19140 [Oscillatoriales cyanobacterium]TAD99874.1 MAG: hypothetical protein EAZ96_22265 [Oscillatoriales cyanobacterium]TAF02102.1 MAG: hypothetical protein EAZ78_15860 [Oscillatoriales cyanobacterium]TAF32419.1 MAG: hypothetical protein EAZ68_20965 [Oscillatoriales cyanobacterium]
MPNHLLLKLIAVLSPARDRDPLHYNLEREKIPNGFYKGSHSERPSALAALFIETMACAADELHSKPFKLIVNVPMSIAVLAGLCFHAIHNAG